jgi:predicted  nucleic acid-binding Zn-ribbon protein
MTSSVGALQDLLAVQDIDTALDQARHRLAHLPARVELVSVDARVAKARGELGELEAQVAALRERQGTAEAELAATEQRASGISQRMYGGTVSASKDLQAMSAELGHLKERSSTLEDAILEVLEEVEPLDVRAGELRSTIAGLGEERASVVERLASEESLVAAEITDLEGRRRDAAGVVPEALLATYERLRTRLGGVGVARLVGNHCDGCHLTLSAMELDRVRHLPEGEVYSCEQCSRILVP